MGIIKWSPLKDLLNMQENIGKIFDESFKNIQGEWVPAIDVIESDKNIILIAELPGVNEEDMEIQITNGILSLKGEKKLKVEYQSEEYACRQECSYGKFIRTFAIPASINPTKVKAKLKDGVLQIILEKDTENHIKTIKVDTE